MRTIYNAILPINEVPNEVSNFLKDKYSFADAETLSQLFHYTSVLQDDLWTYIEYPYVDKFYLDSYYSYFSTKLKNYDRDSIRISFFSLPITLDHFRDGKKETIEKLQEAFRGFLTIRPTLPKIIGRSMISPRALKFNNFLCCRTKMEVLINGVKLSIEGFPYSSQDTELLTCAETTLLGIMEYFGNRYPEYKPVLPSQIVQSLSPVAYERQIPSHGLTAAEISWALKSFGFGARVYTSEAYRPDLKKIFNYYAESGIPFVAIFKNTNIVHGIIVIGHENWDSMDLSTLPSEKIEILDEKTSEVRTVNVIDIANHNLRYVAIDDNYPPYQLAQFDDPATYYNDLRFAKPRCEVISIIIPLYQKIYLEALQARTLVFSMIKNDIISQKISGQVVLRLFLASSRSFKNAISVNESIDRNVRDLILLTVMAKFIWVAELSTPELFGRKKAFGLIALDATEGNERSLDAMLFFIHDNNFIAYNDSRELESQSVPFTSFDLYKENLKGAF